MNHHPDRDLSTAVAALARQVEDLQKKTARTDHLHAQVEELAGLVAQLAERSSTPGGDGDGTDAPTPAPSWLALRGKGIETVRPVLDALLEWVRDVYLQYADARPLPECWLWHPDIIEELLWLMHDWRAAYRSDAEAYYPAAANWHDRYRPAAVARITESARACSLVRHLEPHQTTVPVADAAAQIAHWWSNPDAPAPAPTEHHFDLADAAHREEALTR